jgi:hypothetical protein
MASKAFDAHAHVMANAHNANAMTAATTRGCHERVITADVAMIGGARALRFSDEDLAKSDVARMC